MFTARRLVTDWDYLCGSQAHHHDTWSKAGPVEALPSKWRTFLGCEGVVILFPTPNVFRKKSHISQKVNCSNI